MYLTQALHRAVQQQPDKPAVHFAGRQLTFAQYAERVARLAGALQKLGLQAGDRVGMLALNSDRYLEYQMATPWAGGVLNPCNTRWSQDELLYAIEDSDTHILLMDDTFREMAEALRRKSDTLRHLVYAGNGATPPGMLNYEELVQSCDPVVDALRSGDDLAGIFYTGGTTGSPKGVMLSHRNLVLSGLQARAEGLSSPGAIYLHVPPMFHLSDIACAQPHWIEGSVHFIEPKFDPERILDSIEANRISHVMLVPTMIQMLVDHPSMAKPRDLSSLKLVVYGASPMSEALLARAFAVFPQVGFIQAYGMTETTAVSTINSAFNHTPAGQRLGKLRSAGRASYCCEIRIVDENGADVPRGTVGEVLIRGPLLMQGYWNKPEATSQAMRDGWMHTGDGARMDEDGYIFIADRIKDMIISGGENIYSAEVENALAQHPDVAASAVIGIPSDRWGEAVHAVVVRKPGARVDATELIDHCKSLIAGYKCPRSVDFRDTLPLSGAGKVLKTQLRAPFWQGHDRAVA